MYLFSLIMWTYRNTFHYPHTVSVVQRMMAVPPSMKFVLMFGNYLLFSMCPWENPNIKMYVILFKILLNLISESLLVGFLFSIIFGFKIVRNDLPVRYFVTLLVSMLMNYIVIFVLMVFDQYYRIGTILYSTLNFWFMMISWITWIITFCRLKALNSNTREIQQVISEKMTITIQTGILITCFYMFEVVYHGVLAYLGIPVTRYEETTFYMFHESTDCVIIIGLMFSLRAREYIPYFRVVNFDENEEEDQEPHAPNRANNRSAQTIQWAITNQ